MNRPRHLVGLVPWVLAVLGAVVPVLGSGFIGWPIAVGWLVAMSGVLLGPTLLGLDQPARVLVDGVALVGTSTVFGPLGGWWFMPAVAARLTIDIRAAQDPRSDHVTFRDAD